MKNELSAWHVLLVIGSLLSFSCGKPEKLFEKRTPSETGIDFVNTITESKEHNVFTYQYYYNGNGVAVGDLNGDGLADIFFTGNQTPSKLYLNKGHFHFEDITARAGVTGRDAWRTGATMVDINGDGLLDIYVCYSGFGTDEDRAKQLFINHGNDKDGIPTFTEEAAAYGLDAIGTYSSQAAFFDYDHDGDLDMFLLDHANEFYSPFFNTTRLRTLRHPRYGNRLYRNDNGHFRDVSEEAGIFGGGNNFGLGIAISDINNDGWPDILVSNDFHEQDYLYLNKGDGAFREVAQQVFSHMSRNSMGLDIADFNNDLLPDVVTLDMLPESNYRQKILQGPDEYDKFNLMVDSGYGCQYNRNMLQLHRGFTADGLPVFSEIGQLSGISNTDWSWSSLFADFDNDGWKDLFITNGYLRESTNMDFMRYQVAEALKQAAGKGLDLSTPASYANNMPLYDLVKKMPSTKISNYMFRNKGDLSFADQTADWGLDEKGVSSGAVYVDLDNDGDLDLVVCNNNDPVWIYENHENERQKNHFIRIRLRGDGKNLYGMGAKVIVSTSSGDQMQEMYPVRGYQSSMDYVLHFGLGQTAAIRSIRVCWTADSATVTMGPSADQTLTIEKKDMVKITQPGSGPTLFSDLNGNGGIGFVHKENEFVDFKREFLLPYQLSRQGPRMAKGDVDHDGREDIFIGGAAGQGGRLYLQTADGQFRTAGTQPWQKDSAAEDIGSLFFDADNDGDLDLYIVSGGNEWTKPGETLQDRLYKNDGKGHFTKVENALPKEAFSGSCVVAADFDGDGDLDLFVGARCIPGYYPYSAGDMLLRNDYDKAAGQCHFTDITQQAAGDPLFRAGMVTDAVWADVDKDGWPDLMLAGDWMPLTIFHNEKGKKFTNTTDGWGLKGTDGFWCRIVAADIDHDGDTDFIVGNLGTNTQFRTDARQPLVTYVGDFNEDGTLDPVMTWYIQDSSYPFNSRDELTQQMPTLKKKFLRYAAFGTATINDILDTAQMARAKKYYVYNTHSSLLINHGGKFEVRPLPQEAQFSMNSVISYEDYDGDGREDILLAGNFFPFRVQQGRCDAGMGSLLKGDGKGGFTAVDRQRTGLCIKGDTRDMVELKGTKGKVLVFSKNDGPVQAIKVNP
jgi:hypothetical protein